MIGAIIGDIAGSRFEFEGWKSKDFEFFHWDSDVTDDSILTLAIAEAILNTEGNWEECLRDEAAGCLRKYVRKYPHPMGSYGTSFEVWARNEEMGAYGSYGNGAAMRVSAAGWAGRTLGEVKMLSRLVTSVTHNHREGLKGAEATATCIYLARMGHSKGEIREYVEENYYRLDRTVDEIRKTYGFRGSCQESVPEAITAFLESQDFEDSIRSVISLGGDADTLGAINGAIAEAYYGVPDAMRRRAMEYLDEDLKKTLLLFETKCQGRGTICSSC